MVCVGKRTFERLAIIGRGAEWLKEWVYIGTRYPVMCIDGADHVNRKEERSVDYIY